MSDVATLKEFLAASPPGSTATLSQPFRSVVNARKNDKGLPVDLRLHTDAGERVVMAQTSLALVAESAGPKDVDRTLVLSSLFRPSSTGVVKDDAAPLFWEMLRERKP